MILHFYYKHRKFDGEVFAMYVFWYGLGRFFIEGLRTDSLMVGHLRISQFVAAVSVIAALIVIIAARSKIKQNGGCTLYKDTEESKTILAEAERRNAEYDKKRTEKKHRKEASEEKLDPKDRLTDDETEDNENGKDN